jgi:hypothetical protein
MKVFIVTITIFDDDDGDNVIKTIKPTKAFTTEKLAEIYVSNQIFKMLVEMKKHLHDKLCSTGNAKRQTSYVDKDGNVNILYKDDLSIMLKLREIFLGSDVCDYLIDYDIEELDIIEEL